ncbi:RagB/SusD family nutrient uptake outer membrane protein [Pinibacter aurantiacus]|uniref:RagB/SusD family nutrient uptake outer membrane protein n=1 Tax=Pinibacter aurantiacus TaxID=2851599 RepID=A0A9E2SB79_9BACT|nr:RagB/SusD family nutrient uptake outer membrane protein [Pinibacter aurantiacus]MBV4358258.1 RagB/SusD family nutrient uptake outer membrane protein [Pinibacter aurantiacus]
MKNTFLKYTLIAGTAVMLTAGCSKSFLDQPINGKLSEDQFYTTEKDATMAVTGVYNAMQYEYYTAWTSMYMLKTLPSDESNAAGSGSGDQAQYQQIDQFTLDAQNSGVLAGWRTCYYTIFRANKVINKTKPTSANLKQLVAEAKTIRAYCYLDLVTLWGDVPLITADVSVSDIPNLKRAPKADIYALIQKDLNEAIPDIKAKSAYPASDKFRVSKGTAQAILGKALLYQQKWADAATQFDNVINSGEYDLGNSLQEVFSKQGEFGTESIFEVSFSSGKNYDWGNFPWGNIPQANIHVQLMGPRSDYYTKAPTDSLLGGWGFNSPKKGMNDAFVAAGDVQRRKATLMSEAELTTAGGKWTAPTAYEYEGFFQRKYGTYSAQTVSSGIAELNYGTNWRYIRFADVLLMDAEAYNKAGNDGAAKTALNRLRVKRGLPAVATSGDALFQDIVKERQLELAFEGFRFIDLVRWGMADKVLGPLGFVKGKHELMPIPDADVKTAKLGQNPNY